MQVRDLDAEADPASAFREAAAKEAES